MFKTKNKTKQNFILLIKILLAVWSCGYIFSKIKEEQANFITAFESTSNFSLWLIFGMVFILLFLSLLNWFFEILKWKILVSEVCPISLKTASIQSLIAHAVAVFTPNRIGDFGAKILFFTSEKHQRILGLNFLNNMAQMAVTVLFGIMGFLLLNEIFFDFLQKLQFHLVFWVIFSLVLMYFLLKYFFKKTFTAIQTNLKLTTKKKGQVFAFSLLRYLLFSHQYFIIGWALGWNIDYAQAMPFIFVLYLVASILPSIFILDTALKAGIGIYLFNMLDVSSYIIVVISSIMWLVNFAFPAIVGNVLLLQLKMIQPSTQQQIRIS
ncbi:lysylphosphatidylglycerol synthase domain-containing protein [Psychroflexus planctonicus]|uniref:Lysylphosphatidylglycerol synthase TM region n=1 Tax=Psychroflexus planctonicus TaxID=1526575 RepID=A0ABQ1SJ92_9FLAO|nr:lysylphosphatidylglycerol synthase domain-containing protein [Psychroflexus planctonicus]GGE37622.1 hypothetical protein GCM10010832_17330 [Psychroflexus planctonicus]